MARCSPTMPKLISKVPSPSPTTPSARALPKTLSNRSLKNWKNPSSNSMPVRRMLAQTMRFAPASFLFTREERNHRREFLHLRISNDIIGKAIQFTPSPHHLGHLVSRTHKKGGHLKRLLDSNPVPATLANQLFSPLLLLLLPGEHRRNHHVQFQFARSLSCGLAHPCNFLLHRCR